MKKISLKKDGLNQLSWKLILKIVKKNLLLVILCPLLITIFGSVLSLVTSKNLYYSQGSLLFTDSTHESSIMAMANMAGSDLVYDETCKSLKEKNIQINGNLEYSSDDLRKITKITPIVTSNKIEIRCTSGEKTIVKSVVDELLDNAVQYGIDYALFKDHIMVNKYGTEAVLISKGLPYKFLASFGVSLILTCLILCIKQKRDRKIIDADELCYLGLTPVIIKKDDMKEMTTVFNKELEITDVNNTRVYITMAPSNTLKSDFIQILFDMNLPNKVLLIDLLHNSKKELDDEYELESISENIDAIYFKKSLFGILKFKDKNFLNYIEEIFAQYNKVFIICEDNTSSTDMYMLYEFTKNIVLLLEQDVTVMNSFVYSYEHLPEDACISIIYVE